MPTWDELESLAEANIALIVHGAHESGALYDTQDQGGGWVGAAGLLAQFAYAVRTSSETRRYEECPGEIDLQFNAMQSWLKEVLFTGALEDLAKLENFEQVIHDAWKRL